MKRIVRKACLIVLCVIITTIWIGAVADDAGTWTCPKCGSVMTLDFCTQCGTPKPIGEIVCSVCGEKYPSDADVRFCGKCGSEMTKVQVSDYSNTEKKNTELALYGIWEISNYVDEFNRPTGSRYIKNRVRFNGTFSNSATNNSNLSVKLLIDTHNISIMLYEYGNYQVKTYSSIGDDYSIKVLDSIGHTHSISGVMYSDRIEIKLKDKDEMLSILAEGGEVRFSITERGNNINKYSFAVTDATGFVNAYKDLAGKELIPVSTLVDTSPTPSLAEIRETEETDRRREIHSYAKEIAEPIGFDGYLSKSAASSAFVNGKFRNVRTDLQNIMNVFEFFFKNKSAVEKSLSSHKYEKDYDQLYTEIKQMLKELDNMSLRTDDRAYFDYRYKKMPK